jgi:nitroimidazol reductase NimA-like FMN-containing flavoprotein (pyridoxamine 5'-phosphate oxidase superfamily)
MIVELAALIVERADLPSLEVQEQEARESAASNTDYRAVKLYSYAVELQDLGKADDARRMLERIVEEFPDFVQAKQTLEIG